MGGWSLVVSCWLLVDETLAAKGRGERDAAFAVFGEARGSRVVRKPRVDGEAVEPGAPDFVPPEDLGVGMDASRVTSAAGLSSRRPRKAAWRTSESAVQVAKRTWATSRGLTQCTPRMDSAGGLANGMVERPSGSSRSRRSLWVFWLKPVRSEEHTSEIQ